MGKISVTMAVIWISYYQLERNFLKLDNYDITSKSTGKMSNPAMTFYKYTTFKINYSPMIYQALFETRCSKRLAKVRFNTGNISFFMVYKLDTCNTWFFYSWYVFTKSLYGGCILTNIVILKMVWWKLDLQEEVLVLLGGKNDL